ncbi:MAG: carbon-nitrogen hydrolase family protein [Planctomycetes bacterium]|nr:carbon-nitrogen hydrolase family protein [Planctomycetota bacterium]NOG54091.1 carbon-nitrogen hydrolase family protein [Planctomycetota bacterium]
MTRIALIQQSASDDRVANRETGLANARRAVEEHHANVIAFAELAFESFYPQKRATPEVLALAEPIPGPTTDRFCALAKELGVVIVLNLFERDGDNTFDSSPVIDADGSILGSTRMFHVPDMPCFHEQGYYTLGDHGAPVYDTAAGRIGTAICYDRHFPEYMRALGVAGADLVITPQAGAVGEWPPGLYEAEMRIAAFQNGYFSALCNRVGQEEFLDFAGESFVCDPGGNVIARAGTGTDEILTCDVDLTECAKSHARRIFMGDRRPEAYADWLARPFQHRDGTT